MPARATDAGTNRRATRSNDATASPCILALDPGHKLGYAVDDPAAPNRCRNGVCQLPRTYPETGRELRFAETWLISMIEQFAVRVLIWEAPIPFGGKKGSTTITNQHAIEFALALGGVFDLVGAKLELVACWKANMGTVRHHFTGNGRADKGMVHARALAVGYDVASYDASDAVAIWDFAKHKYKAEGLVAGPLFADPLRSMRRQAPELEE